MKYRAIIQEKDGWWIGWLVEISGVNAQEKTREKLIESLRLGAEDMLKNECEIPEGSQLETIEV
jgi:predicted RNase H-like HicB family nuclease